MNKIVTATEIKNYKDIGNKIDENKINPIIEQAQLTELKDMLGSEFYFDVLNNLDNPIYQDLLSGSTFTYNEITYNQDGLKALTADYFMAKYVMQINTNITRGGRPRHVTPVWRRCELRKRRAPVWPHCIGIQYDLGLRLR